MFLHGKWKNLGWFLLALLPAASIAALAWHYYPFYVDDAFISLRYVDRLLEGKGLTWNDGERVEGYSNLLWILLTALLGAFGVELVSASRVICLLASLATVGALFAFARNNRMHWLVAFAGAMFLARARCVAIWSLGGLESSLHMALVSWIVVLGWQRFYRNERAASWGALAVLMGLVAINRPDGIMFTGLFGAMFFALAMLQRSAANMREAVRIMLAALAFPLMQLLFRLYYYHDIVPNTFYAKVAINSQRLREGLYYIGWSLYWFIPVILCIFLLLAFVRRRIVFYEILAMLLPVVVWLLAVAAAGGDGFPGYRHFLPVAGIFCMILMLAMQAAMQLRTLLAVLIVVVALCGFEMHQRGKVQLEDAAWHGWEWKCKAIGEQLHTWFAAEQPLVAVTGAGSLPYYSKLPTLDMFGLNDPYLTHHRPESFGHGYLGHELFNSDYILSRKPDIIVLHDGVENNYPMPDVVKLKEMYDLRWIALPNDKAALWVRKDSPIYQKLLKNALPVTNP